jgi:hypothetical protein
MHDESTTHPPTHWVEGGIIGAAALGILGAALTGGLCAYSDTNRRCTGATIGGGVMGAGVGFVLGALIGGSFPKRKQSP